MGSVFSFIETRLFTRLVKQYLSDQQYAELQMARMANPELGGHRWNRWCAEAALGRSGPRQAWRLPRHLLRTPPEGHYLHVDDVPENVADSIPAHVLREIREELGDD